MFDNFLFVDLFLDWEIAETDVQLSKEKNHIYVQIDMDKPDVTADESKVTYEEIREWGRKSTGFMWHI